MKERRIEHTYACSADVFWNRIFLDDEYNRKLFVEELHFDTWRVLRTEERGNEVHRVVEAVPPMGDLPSALKKVMESGLGYEERGVLDRAAQRYRLEATPRSLSSRITITGELFTTPLTERSCRRIYIGRIDARVFGIAGLIEDRFLNELEKSYSKAAEFTNRWIAQKGL